VVFPTIEFAAFFVVVLLVSWLLMPTPKYWKPFILAASLAFYAAADWRWVFLLLASIVGNQAAATVISRMARGPGRKAVLIAALVGNLALLGVFKYLGFFVDGVNSLVTAFGFSGEQQVLELALPVGSPSSRSRRSATWLMCTADGRRWPRRSTRRCTSRSSRTWWPGRSCGPPSSSHNWPPRAARATSRRLRLCS
jgi:hypothetical protein